MLQGNTAQEYLASKWLYLHKLAKYNGLTIIFNNLEIKRALKVTRSNWSDLLAKPVRCDLILPHPRKGGLYLVPTLAKKCFKEQWIEWRDKVS